MTESKWDESQPTKWPEAWGPPPTIVTNPKAAAPKWTCHCNACQEAAARHAAKAERTPVDGNRYLKIGLAFAALVILAGVTLALILAAGEPGGAGVVASPR